eukprot:14269103-Alexandrium_andersonii.AAC.1
MCVLVPRRSHLHRQAEGGLNSRRAPFYRGAFSRWAPPPREPLQAKQSKKPRPQGLRRRGCCTRGARLGLPSSPSGGTLPA